MAFSGAVAKGKLAHEAIVDMDIDVRAGRKRSQITSLGIDQLEGPDVLSQVGDGMHTDIEKRFGVCLDHRCSVSGGQFV